MKKYFIILIVLLSLPVSPMAIKGALAQEDQLIQSSTSSSSGGQNSSTGALRGLEITPFLLDLEVPKGGSIDSEIVVTNRSSTTESVVVESRDFLPGSEGQPEFVPDTDFNDETFSLASWVKIKDPTQFVLQPNESRKVEFSLNPSERAEQGTHYGAILFSYGSGGASGNMSEVQQSLGTIILVKYGVTRENGKVQQVLSDRIVWNPSRVTITSLFENTGNVHVKPKGEVYIKNMWGKVIETPFVNRDAANVLPKTIRGFVSFWYPSNWSFGLYTAETVLIFGNTRLEARDKHYILVVPYYFDILIVIAIILLLWYFLHGRHWHKRRIINKHLNNNSKE